MYMLSVWCNGLMIDNGTYVVLVIRYPYNPRIGWVAVFSIMVDIAQVCKRFHACT